MICLITNLSKHTTKKYWWLNSSRGAVKKSELKSTGGSTQLGAPSKKVVNYRFFWGGEIFLQQPQPPKTTTFLTSPLTLYFNDIQLLLSDFLSRNTKSMYNKI